MITNEDTESPQSITLDDAAAALHKSVVSDYRSPRVKSIAIVDKRLETLKEAIRSSNAAAQAIGTLVDLISLLLVMVRDGRRTVAWVRLGRCK